MQQEGYFQQRDGTMKRPSGNARDKNPDINFEEYICQVHH